MALQSIRYGGGVWKQQEEARVALQNRLAQRELQLKEARAEVDRVHAQCVGLLRENHDLRASLGQNEQLLLRRDEELHAAKQNVTELMALLTQANESRVALEKDRNAMTTLWHNAREQEQQASGACEKLARRCGEMEREAERLRDQLYEAQEKCEYQEAEIARQSTRMETLMRSNEARDRQVAALIRERDAAAQTVAQLRSQAVGGLGAMPRRDSTARRRTVTWTDVPPDVATHEMSGVKGDATASSIKEEYERQKQQLRAAATLAKARFERERERNEALHGRVQTLQKAHDELLVRFREASKARQRAEVIRVAAPKGSSAGSTTLAA